MKIRSIDTLTTQQVLERQFPHRRSVLKRDILQSALVCFNEYGIEATTIEQIRLHCNTSVGNIYHHFENKEGLVTALFFCALNDQSQLRTHYLATAKTAQEGVAALIYSYVDWVTNEPELARFQLRARMVVATSSKAEELNHKNQERNRLLYEWLSSALQNNSLDNISSELMPSLIIGQAEHYCRTWLSGRAKSTPQYFREYLAQAAWSSMQVYM